ncbi:anti-lipopolysaccharide factor-like [Homarus americanus]|uniref:Anti-lipopolysaccharide factor-like 2 n=1 Tax=Homarus americanus TaxID=6706 RepID=A0A8J5JAQ5_HOMAM|nr:anti-lipopolysaccharide factor-like [Homarus americanus]KAG7153929.1 anti-lipopolysaccharide factor-like 2 [Homarus americanus]
MGETPRQHHQNHSRSSSSSSSTLQDKRMRPSVLCALVMVAVMAPYLPQCHAQGWEALLPAFVDKLSGLWRNGEVELLGRHYCSFAVKPKIKSWELYFLGTVSCPGWTRIRGHSETRSYSNVVNKATEDFLRNALKAGIITEEDLNTWLNN